VTGRAVACVGVGNVGRAWAIVFARAGLTVRLFDCAAASIEQRALPAIRQSVNDLAAAQLIEDPERVLSRLEPAASLAAAVANVSYVQESVREDLAVKRAVFDQLGRFAPSDAILASSTSAIAGSRFLDAATHPERCLVAHPVNPPYLIPLVEICPTPWTTPDTLAHCTAFMKQVGQEPIHVQREVPGFILNRLQYTLVAEALHLVGEGYCSAEDVDKVLKHGLALRWAFIGPFEVAHLNATGGFQGFVDNLGSMMRAVAKDARTDYQWGPDLATKIHRTLTQKTPLDRLSARQAWRDRRIMALRKHLSDAAQRLGD